MADLIKLLVDYREGHSLTQEQMAEALHISVRTYQSIEQTGKIKKVPVLDAIKKLLNTQDIALTITDVKDKKGQDQSFMSSLSRLLTMLEKEQDNVKNAHDIIRILAGKVKPDANDPPKENFPPLRTG